MLRPPAVAGQFYPGGEAELFRDVRSYLVPEAGKERALAVVSPHAGYVYSGHVAGAVFSSVVMPDRFIILCPNHTGLGATAAIMADGSWQIPGAEIPIDGDLARAVLGGPSVLEDDHLAHLREHSLEVQLPFIVELVKEPAIVPICLKSHRFGDLEGIGMAIAEAVRKAEEEVLIVASTDMSHFLPDEEARRIDRRAIDKIIDLDPEGLLETVLEEGISMCGVSAVTAALVAARELGAGKADLIKYATSGDIFGDRSQVVGYAGIRIS